ncbi:MAG TPA: hypothetical protein VEH81_16140, partial [Ktedonobacteraceae bacterium]|nr:hypothetical protein [Ktedonobacteraceae bacterium]
MSNFEDNTRQPVPQSIAPSSMPGKEASSQSNVDFVLMGIAAFLFLACIWVAVDLIIPKLEGGIAPHFTFQLFFTLL